MGNISHKISRCNLECVLLFKRGTDTDTGTDPYVSWWVITSSQFYRGKIHYNNG